MKTLLLRLLFIFLGLAMLIAFFYAEEDWRGKRAWENCKRELKAKGEVLDWNAYIPAPVPDGQNIFKAPKMQEWFVGRSETDLSKRLANPKTPFFDAASQITNEVQARDYLAWSDQFKPDFDLIREALKRPYARMDGDYSQSSITMPVPNFVTVRSVAQTLAQRAHCYLLLGQPEKALSELTLFHDMCRLLEGEPTGKPMTLIAAMLDVAVAGLYVDAIGDGIQLNAWQKPQLAALQEQLKGINLTPIGAGAFKMELVGLVHACETRPPNLASLYFVDSTSSFLKTKTDAFWWRLKHPMYLVLKVAPRGWLYQNMVNCAAIESKPLDGFDPKHDTISPRIVDTVGYNLKQLPNHKLPFNLLAAIVIPNLTRAIQTLAHNQTMANEAQIACALERYHLVHGKYPETLDALVPQFIEKLPHDIIGGQPLHYCRMPDGKFLLYSVGWNEKDDGGGPGTLFNPKQGDWVWQYPTK